MAELAGRNQLEGTFAKRVARLSARHRRELESLLGDPPDISNVPQEFWERVQKETEEETAALLLLIFAASYSQHAEDATGSSTIRNPQQVEQQAAAWAAQRARELAQKYVETSIEKLGKLSADWQTAIAAGEIVPKRTVQEKTLEMFGPDRAAGIAETETTSAASAGGESAVRETVGESAQDTWYTADDNRVCEICGPMHGLKRQDWTLKFPAGPPAHPRCRCWIEYAHEKGKGES